MMAKERPKWQYVGLPNKILYNLVISVCLTVLSKHFTIEWLIYLCDLSTVLEFAGDAFLISSGSSGIWSTLFQLS